jgi:hypothetical protein
VQIWFWDIGICSDLTNSNTGLPKKLAGKGILDNPIGENEGRASVGKAESVRRYTFSTIKRAASSKVDESRECASKGIGTMRKVCDGIVRHNLIRDADMAWIIGHSSPFQTPVKSEAANPWERKLPRFRGESISCGRCQRRARTFSLRTTDSSWGT